jgi:hypothetical protein
MTAVTEGLLRMPELPEITQRLRELWAGKSQDQVGIELGYTGSYIGQVQRGQRPSREFIERAIARYELDRQQWLEWSGYAAAPSRQDERQALIADTAREVLRQQADPSVAAETLLDRASELTWDPEFSDATVQGFKGADQLSKHDLDLVNHALRVLLTEQKRRQGRE